MTNTINGRTPEEIKRGLECCNSFNACQKCPYEKAADTEHGWGCVVIRNADTLAYIQQLERERDAAVRDMYHAASDGGSFCDICKYKGEPCDKRKFEEMECWQWRGVQEVERQ